MNYKIGFMSFVVIISIIFIFLLVSEKIEAQTECVGPCGLVRDCTAACISKGYQIGQCVGWDDPDICCCN
ncbi:hypothetical protein EUTSA_v10015992mg [Eutrema salsugineum]|uniref:Uncharacterized protein n=1 Tax=Eutrema salsugineum TaxID=72664 RepID=V4NBG9_EUTSA|nr:hypothetical protein EUTSA_v10015992mg [Eutrema salsugineum]